ncbi:hypothetical protein [Stieleria varia]|uniref:50S ribosomal protein L7/L12 n=1 Tax=Stieleria varia TaxID=2528005 RepID=A0A5C6A1Q9_9BACT|nr:hypothetical protein [Stieleria varia]TWT93794.1 hypothetical protein Pla52n_56220 [Stieleria varia]
MANELSPGQIDQLRDELRAGRKLGAIKMHMDITGSSLSKAKSFVEDLQRDSNLEGHDSLTEGIQADELSDEQMDQILDQLKKGEKLAAIHLYRAHSGQNLKESLRFIDALIERMGDQLPASLLQEKKSGCAGAALVLLTVSSGAALTAAVLALRLA